MDVFGSCMFLNTKMLGRVALRVHSTRNEASVGTMSMPALLTLVLALSGGAKASADARSLAIDQHLKANGFPVLTRPQNQMQVASMELIGNLAGAAVQRDMLVADGPAPFQPP